ncbi:GAP family protein [Microbacterium marmarense]|uniref:GAP family protein n=1 Tax=Microbacterium marmarense TaxID=3122051 RepID=A0ABU8LS59_9MICO
MLHVLADLLTLGVAVAISPIAMVAVILMATSGKGRTNGTAFMLGSYLFCIVFVGSLVVIGRSAGADDEESATHLLIDAVEVALGAFLVVMAVRQWQRRSHTGTPQWMNAIDGMTVWKAFIVGILISGPLSPKDLPLLFAASGRISQAELVVHEVVAVVLIFGVIGVMAITIPWLISVIAPSQVEMRLSGLRDWLIGNHAVIMTVLFLILGAKLIGAGVADLVS